MGENKLVPVVTDQAPSAIGPYSQAVRAGNYLFLSGQIALDPATGQMSTGPVEEQTARVMKNLHGVLSSQGLSFSDVVKTTIFLKSMADFPKVNEIYQSHLRPPYPARSTVEVARLPKEALVEIEAVVFCPNA